MDYQTSQKWEVVISAHKTSWRHWWMLKSGTEQFIIFWFFLSWSEIKCLLKQPENNEMLWTSNYIPYFLMNWYILHCHVLHAGVSSCALNSAVMDSIAGWQGQIHKLDHTVASINANIHYHNIHMYIVYQIPLIPGTAMLHVKGISMTVIWFEFIIYWWLYIQDGTAWIHTDAQNIYM